MRGSRFSAQGFCRSAPNSGHKSLLDPVETAPAQDRGNDSARSLSVTEAHVSAAEVAVDSHFRDERDTDAGRNHAQETAELAAFKGDVRRNPGTGAGPEAEIPETVAVAQHDERFPAEILEGKRFCRSARMVSSQHSEEGLRADRKQFQVFVAQGESKNRDIDGQVPQTFYQNGCRFFHDAQFGVGVVLCKSRRITRDQIGRDSWNHTHGYAAAKVCVLIGRAQARHLHLFENRAGLRNKSATRFRKADAAAEAVKELCAKIFLEFQDLLRERGLGDLTTLGGAAEVACVRDGANIS